MDIMTPMKSAWMLTKTGEPFAPKTLLSQVSTDDGKLLEDKLNEDFNEVSQKLSIPEVTDTVLDGSYPGLLKVNEIGGKMEQFTTTGAQLFDDDTVSFISNSSSATDIIKLNYGCEFTTNIIGANVGVYSSKKYTGDYTISCDVSLSDLNFNSFRIGSGDNAVVLDVSDYTAGTVMHIEKNMTFSENSLIFYVNNNNKEVGTVVTVSNIMFNAGTEPLPWEPYTGGIATPNPSYPQEIKCVKGKNLLDCRGLTEQTINGGTFTPVYDDNGNLEYVEVNGTFTALTTYNIGVFYPNVDETYIITDGGTTNVNLKLNRTDIIIPSGSYTWEPSASETYKELIVIRVESGKTVNEKIYPMIRHASVADPTYVPYGLLRVKTHGAQLFDMNDVRYIEPLAFDGSFGTFKFISTDNNTRVYYIPAKPNMVYTISKELGSFLRVGTCESIPSADGLVTNVNSDTSKNVATITTGPNDRYIAFYPLLVSEMSTLSYDAVIEKIMLNYGETALPYEPYTESSYTFSQPIDLYGTDDVQDVIRPEEIDRKYVKRIFDGSENWSTSTTLTGRFLAVNLGCKSSGRVLCTQAKSGVPFHTTMINECYLSNNSNGQLVINTEFETLDEWKAHLASKPMEVVYELAEETTEPLPLVDQIGLNNLLTYNDVTYVEFDCDGPQPTFKGEYPTSKENSYVIQSLSDSLTVNGHTVESDVPANAKFTDTVYDDTALKARVTSVENQINGFLSLDSTVVVKTGKFKTGNDNRIETTVIPAGANIVASTYYDGKIYSTDGTRLYVSDLTTSTQYIMTIQGQAAQITGIAVCCDTTGRICIHVVDSQGRASCTAYDNTVANGGMIDFATRMSDAAAIYQDDDKLYLLDNSYRLHTADSSGMGYNNIGMATGSPNLQTISWIKVFGDTLVVGGSDQMNNKMCELYDLSTGNQIEIMVSDTETITFADVCYYEGGLIGVCTENGYFYRAECGKFYNPLVSTNSEASPMLWREFNIDVDTSYGVAMYVEGSYLVIYNTQACYLFNSDGNNYYANTNMLVNVFSRDEGIYFVYKNDGVVALYETKEISLLEAIMKIKA